MRLTLCNRFCIISFHLWNRRNDLCRRGPARSKRTWGSRGANIGRGPAEGTFRRSCHCNQRILLVLGCYCYVDSRARWPQTPPRARAGAASSAPRTRGSAGSCSTRLLPAWRLEREPLAPTTTTTRPVNKDKQILWTTLLQQNKEGFINAI